MFYAGAPKEDLEAILATLTKELGEDYVKLIMAKNPPSSVKRQVDWLHLMCCQKDHDGSEAWDCEYYDEEMLEDGWSKYDHREWLSFWKELTKTFAQDSLQRFIYTVGMISRDIIRYTENNPGLLEFLAVLRAKNPGFLVPTPPKTVPAPAETSEAEDAGTTIALFPEG